MIEQRGIFGFTKHLLEIGDRGPIQPSVQDDGLAFGNGRGGGYFERRFGLRRLFNGRGNRRKRRLRGDVL